VELNELLYELKKKEEFELKVDVTPEIKLPAGLNKELIYEISAAKNEPAWMTEHRIKSFEIFEKWHEPNWGVERNELDLSKIVPYVKPNAKRPIIGKKYRRRLRSHSTDLVFQRRRESIWPVLVRNSILK